MTDVIVLLVVGAFGGLLGSVAGPFLSHRFDRKRRDELRAERRLELLREMLEAKCADAHSNIAGEFVIRKALKSGASLGEALSVFKRWRRDHSPKNPPVWKPHRIDDKALRTLADELETTDLELGVWLELIDRHSDSEKAIELWSTNAEEIEGKLEDIVAKIDERLDTLNW